MHGIPSVWKQLKYKRVFSLQYWRFWNFGHIIDLRYLVLVRQTSALRCVLLFSLRKTLSNCWKEMRSLNNKYLLSIRRSFHKANEKLYCYTRKKNVCYIYSQLGYGVPICIKMLGKFFPFINVSTNSLRCYQRKTIFRKFFTCAELMFFFTNKLPHLQAS